MTSVPKVSLSKFSQGDLLRVPKRDQNHRVSLQLSTSGVNEWHNLDHGEVSTRGTYRDHRRPKQTSEADQFSPLKTKISGRLMKVASQRLSLANDSTQVQNAKGKLSQPQLTNFVEKVLLQSSKSDPQFEVQMEPNDHCSKESDLKVRKIEVPQTKGRVSIKQKRCGSDEYVKLKLPPIVHVNLPSDVKVEAKETLLGLPMIFKPKETVNQKEDVCKRTNRTLVKVKRDIVLEQD